MSNGSDLGSGDKQKTCEGKNFWVQISALDI